MAEVTRTETSESARVPPGEFGYPVGHLGHLTESQEAAFEQFKKLCIDRGLYKPSSEGVLASRDEVTLLRFLRARRFEPGEGLVQFQDTEKWREVNEISHLYDNIDVRDYEETRELYPQWTGRRDKRGIPVYVFEVAPLTAKRMSTYAKSATNTKIVNASKNDKKGAAAVPARLLRLFALYENLVEFIMPLCSNLRDRPHPDTPISQSNNIVDISGVGLKQFWNLRVHMQDASTLATAHYPETLDRIFVIGAPSFFPTVWSWIKRWFDPITTSKIFIISQNNVFKTLSGFIDPANIPKKYGGQLDYTYGMPPVLDPAEDQHVVWNNTADMPSRNKWPEGPMKWVAGENGTMVIMAVGSVHGKERREKVATFYPDGKNVDGTEAAHMAMEAYSGVHETAPASEKVPILEAPISKAPMSDAMVVPEVEQSVHQTLPGPKAASPTAATTAPPSELPVRETVPGSEQAARQPLPTSDDAQALAPDPGLPDELGVLRQVDAHVEAVVPEAVQLPLRSVTQDEKVVLTNGKI